ncbi:MAG: hypothetical protein AAGG48_21010 [Planctomycetota bacterium]
MSPIHVEQAIFSSSDRGSMKGYQLVSRSAGIDRDTGNELCRWAPTRLIDERPESWTINAFPVSGDRFAVTRTVVGGPEYSSRGASQIVTSILLFDDQQFSRYLHNPILVARTAMAVGALRLPLDTDEEKLDLVELPGEPLFKVPDLFELRATDGPIAESLDEAAELIGDSRRVALVGQLHPVEAAASLIPRLGSDHRAQFSFTTGLAPAISRPFQLHLLSDADAPMRHTLASQSIQVVEAITDSVTASGRL